MLTTRSSVTSQIAKWGPSKNVVARSALKNLLSSNHDVIDASLDQCYSAHSAVSSAYFQVWAFGGQEARLTFPSLTCKMSEFDTERKSSYKIKMWCCILFAPIWQVRLLDKE